MQDRIEEHVQDTRFRIQLKYERKIQSTYHMASRGPMYLQFELLRLRVAVSFRTK